ncbi:MAG: RNA methyltransferase [Microthrixaceae bacterium]|nr:RNA methyltransferase [Microthrixaceae bacterium]
MGRRSSRLGAGVVVVEGPKVLGELLEAGIPVQRVLYDVDAASSGAVGDVIVAADRAGVPLEAVGRGVLDRVLDSSTPQGVAALVARPKHDLDALSDAGGAPILVAAGVQDPGNLGALVRVAAAAGSPALVCDRESADPWASKALRASVGWALRFPVIETSDLPADLRRLRDRGVAVVLAAPGGPAHDRLDWRRPAALVVGSEGRGVDPSILSEFPDRVSIPMATGVESLNVATAAAVVAFEAARQSRA